MNIVGLTDVTVDHTMLSEVTKLSNLQCSTVCNNVLNNVQGVCQTNIHLLNNKSNLNCHYFFSVFIRKDSSVVAHSLHK